MVSFSFGFFTQLQGRPDQSKSQLYGQFLDTVVAAEELGYKSVWLGQHHFDRGDGRIGSPWALLAAAAARTSVIELGTAVNVLPLEDPIRLAEDVAAVHEISNGRAHLGIGTGGGDREAFAAFGVETERRRDVFDQKLAVLERVLADEPLTGGASLGPTDPPLRERLWVSAGTPERARAAAERGHGLLVGTFYDHPRDAQRVKIDTYLDQWRIAHPNKAPRVGALRFTRFGESRTAVQQLVEAGLDEFRTTVAHHLEPRLAQLTTEQYLRRVTRYGTPQDVLEDLNADPALTADVTHLLVNTSLFPAAGRTTSGDDLDIDRLATFAHEVAPNLRFQQIGDDRRIEV